MLATIPLYIYTRFQYDPCRVEEESGANYGVILKLVRLVRIKRIFALFDSKRVNKLVELLYTGNGRNKKVVFTLVMKNIYSVFRLVLLTIIIMYFIGCGFYLWSTLFGSSNTTFIKNY